MSDFEWVKYIESRIGLARQWRTKLPEHQRLAQNSRYVRILGKGFRAISISRENPCGRLIRMDNGQPVEGNATIEGAIQSADNSLQVGDQNDFRPSAKKREHEIQASLIRHALLNNQLFGDLFDDFSDVFDELIFITDELSTGKLRADVIALGRKSETYFPVFIELKVSRDLTRLKEQAEEAKNLMKIAGDVFIEMLSAASGVPKAKISFGDHRLMFIWPKSTSGRESDDVANAREAGFITSHFVPKADGGYEFVRAM